MPSIININDQLTQEEFINISSSLVLDLIAFFKILEQEIILLMDNATNYTEEELYNEIANIIGE